MRRVSIRVGVARIMGRVSIRVGVIGRGQCRIEW